VRREQSTGPGLARVSTFLTKVRAQLLRQKVDWLAASAARGVRFKVAQFTPGTGMRFSRITECYSS
jgi:hypothetical protein